jgi:hypothetical protein
MSFHDYEGSERETHKRANRLEAMLREAMAFLDKQPQLHNFLSKELRDWWTDQKQRDLESEALKVAKAQIALQRLEDQAQRQRLIDSAMDKLTDEERKALTERAVVGL